MDYCKKQGIPPAQAWAWDKAETAWQLTHNQEEKGKSSSSCFLLFLVLFLVRLPFAEGVVFLFLSFTILTEIYATHSILS